MVRSTFDEKIKGSAITIKEFVDMDFSNTVEFDDEPKFYSRYKEPHYDDWSNVLFDIQLKDILDDRIPDWVYNEEYTEEEEQLVSAMYDNLFCDLEEEYRSEWDSKTQEYYDNKMDDAEEKLGTDERYEEYLEAKTAFEVRRDNYYGWCKHNGSMKDFRKMYGDGNFQSYGEWLSENYGE